MWHVRWYLCRQNVVIFQHVQKFVSCLSSKDVIYKQSWLCFKAQTFPNGLYIRQNDLFKEFQRLRLIAVVFKLALKENPFGNWIFGRLWLVFPLYINCIGRNLFPMVIEKVAVMDPLSSIPESGTFFVLLFHCIWRNLDVFRCLIEVDN